MNKLTVLFQYGGRKYLEKICRDFLKESLGDYPYEFIDLDCSNLTIGAGFNRLIEQVKTEYLIWTPDDFAFFPNGRWAEKAIKILEKRKDIGIIDLRKERDNEVPWGIIEKNQDYLIIKRIGNRVFNLTPFMARTKDIKKIIPLDTSETRKNGAEYSGIMNFRRLNLKLARLNIKYLGVCFHLGWNRSRVLGCKDKL